MQLQPAAAECAAYEQALQKARTTARARGGGAPGGGGSTEMAALMALRQLASLAKVDEAVRIALELIEQGESVVLTTCFVESASRIHSALREQGCGAPHAPAPMLLVPHWPLGSSTKHILPVHSLPTVRYLAMRDGCGVVWLSTCVQVRSC